MWDLDGLVAVAWQIHKHSVIRLRLRICWTGHHAVVALELEAPRASEITSNSFWLGPRIGVQCLCEFHIREWTQEEMHELWP
jgi:hypothetical protein